MHVQYELNIARRSRDNKFITEQSNAEHTQSKVKSEVNTTVLKISTEQTLL